MTLRRLPWITASLVAAAAAATWTLPDHGAALQWTHDAGWWTRVTGQLVHWTTRMGLADLAVVAGAGAWLELRSRPAFAAAIVAAFAACGVALSWGGHAAYRGSSGVAVALVVAASLALAGRPSPRPVRWGARGLLALTVAKLGWEWQTGRALTAGELPGGVGVAAHVHLVGGLIGVLVWWLALRTARAPRGGCRDRHPSSRARGGSRSGCR